MNTQKNPKSLSNKLSLLSSRKPKAQNSKKIQRRKTRKIRKKSFVTSRTGRNLSKFNKTSVHKKQQILYLEDEDLVFTENQELLNKTISQKNDNDIDSEPEIIMLGVKYLHRKLVQAISREQESSRKRIRRVKKMKKVERQNNKIQDYFSRQAPSFNTPSDRRVSVNDMAYLNSIMSSHKATKMSFGPSIQVSTVFSKNSNFTDLKKNNSGKFWIEGVQKMSTNTVNTDIFTTAGEVWSRKDSSQINLHNESLGSMFLESPHRR